MTAELDDRVGARTPPRSSLAWIFGIATAFEGLRAGAGTFRVLVDLPARKQIGAVAFAQFSRATDLATTGLVFYIVFGVGGLVVTLTTCVAAWRLRAPRKAVLLSAVAAACSILVLVATAFAAPIMWAVGSAPDNAAVLEPMFDRFTLWTLLRVLLVDVSFVTILVALVSVLRKSSPD